MMLFGDISVCSHSLIKDFSGKSSTLLHEQMALSSGTWSLCYLEMLSNPALRVHVHKVFVHLYLQFVSIVWSGLIVEDLIGCASV